MELSIFESQEKLTFQLETNNLDFEKALIHNGYVQDGSKYKKSFPLQFPYREKIINNYRKNVESMLKEEAGLTVMNWRDSLDNFTSIAKKAGINWWTTGAVLQSLHGIDTEVGDLDFYFDLSDLDAVYEAFQDYIIEPIISGHRSSTFKLHGLAYSECTICLFFEPNASLDVPYPVHFGPYAAEHLETVNWRGYEIKVPSIELYIRTLERWGELDQAESINRALQRTL